MNPTLQFGDRSEWLPQVLARFKKTGMKRPEEMGACAQLTSTFGHEAFCHSFGFRFHKTAMALYPARLGVIPYLDWERAS